MISPFHPLALNPIMPLEYMNCEPYINTAPLVPYTERKQIKALIQSDEDNELSCLLTPIIDIILQYSEPHEKELKVKYNAMAHSMAFSAIKRPSDVGPSFLCLRDFLTNIHCPTIRPARVIITRTCICGDHKCLPTQCTSVHIPGASRLSAIFNVSCKKEKPWRYPIPDLTVTGSFIDYHNSYMVIPYSFNLEPEFGILR